MDTGSQRTRLLNYLQNTGPITKTESLSELGILNTGARIEELRKRGHEIETEMIRVRAQNGMTRVARYRLLRHADQMPLPL